MHIVEIMFIKCYVYLELRCVLLFDLITTLTQFPRSLFITEKSIFR